MSTHNYTRTAVANEWDVDLTTISKEVETALSGKEFVVRADGTALSFVFVDSLSAGEITTLDTAVSDHQTAATARLLAEYKAEKRGAIDIRTQELIDSGFCCVWNVHCDTEPADIEVLSATAPTACPNDAGHTVGSVTPKKVFSLSANAQRYWLGMFLGKDLLTYPLEVNTLDDLDIHSLADANDVAIFYNCAMGTVKDYLGSGTTLKEAVRDAADTAGVDAVVDNR